MYLKIQLILYIYLLLKGHINDIHITIDNFKN